MKRQALAACIVSSVFAVTMTAQPVQTDFSGTWRMDPERSESIANNYESSPVTLVARQTPTDLIIEARRGKETETLVYKLDGSQTVHPGGVTTRCKWDGAAIVTTTARTISGWLVTIDEIWRLDQVRRELTVVKSLNVQHGYERSSSEPLYSTTKDVFVTMEKQ